MMRQSGEAPFFGANIFLDEILEQVFTQLTPKELKTSMEVCRQFESVITRSPALMKKFVVCWSRKTCSKKNKALLLASERRFSRAYFWHFCSDRSEPEESSLRAMTQFVANHANTLKAITLSFIVKEMINMLPAVSNLEVLVIDQQIWELPFEFKQWPKDTLKKLKHLIFHSKSIDLLSWLLAPPTKLESLDLVIHGNNATARALVPLLQAQDQLTKVLIAISHLDAILGDCGVAGSMKFKAKNIYLRESMFYSAHLANLSTFLMTQKSSLTVLELQKIALFDKDLNALLELTLVELKLTECEFVAPGDSTVANDSVQRLTIGVKGQRQIANNIIRAINKILRSCQTVKTLILSDLNLNEELSLTIATKHTLKNLRLFNCSLTSASALTFPSVEILEVERCFTVAAVRHLESRNPQVKTFCRK